MRKILSDNVRINQEELKERICLTLNKVAMYSQGSSVHSWQDICMWTILPATQASSASQRPSCALHVPLWVLSECECRMSV